MWVPGAFAGGLRINRGASPVRGGVDKPAALVCEIPARGGVTGFAFQGGGSVRPKWRGAGESSPPPPTYGSLTSDGRNARRNAMKRRSSSSGIERRKFLKLAGGAAGAS